MTEHRIENVRINDATQTHHSVSGNPGWLLHTTSGPFRTEPDAALAHAIENFTNPEHPDTYVIGLDAPTITLVLTRTRRVVAIEKDGVRL